ncbi:serine/threonine-protein kinase [Micromonospora sp. NPDC049049]|uniref:serine/threonine-protein kinase n=1 Tax=Micromonospora sp. NPDC049049 TaxID=3155495 RepID=UPI0033F383F8
MASTALKLSEDWALGERIGEGGFGSVFAASSPRHQDAVAKLIPKKPGSARELLFVDLEGARNVVPIVDSGETPDSWVIIMPRAEMSLRQHLQSALSPTEAIAILSDLALALSDLQDRVVHRDLKPENILLLDGHWCVADFGISRYAEATTAPDTQKYSMTPPYAAPEQWRSERATSATDVYAFGVLAYELLAGAWPFKGPSLGDFRDQHLHDEPPALNGVSVALVSLVEECLYKAPQTRPSPSNISARLERAAHTVPGTGFDLLRQANRAEVARLGEQARAAERARSEKERRADIAKSASKALNRIMDAVKVSILEAAPSAVCHTAEPDIDPVSGRQHMRPQGWSINLSKATLDFIIPIGAQMDLHSRFELPIDVVYYARISAERQKGNRNDRAYRGRSHSLWYCDAQEEGRYQWFETAFTPQRALHPSGPEIDPCALDPNDDAAKALGNGLSFERDYAVAWPFTPVVIDELDGFVNRWAGWFADCASGDLRRPSQFSDRPVKGSWRTGSTIIDLLQ